MLEEIWNGFLELTSLFVMPDWGALIALLPVGILVLVILVLFAQLRGLVAAPPARRGKRRVEPRTPAGIHMPGPSWAPVFAAIGSFLLFVGLVFGGFTIVLGAIGLSIGLLYWLREAIVIYDRDVEPPRPLPAVIHEGPPEGVHMPGPSFRPLLASLGVALLFAGLVFGGWVLAVGVLALIVSLLGWLNDARKEYVKVEEADRTGHLENLPDPRMPSTLLAVFAVLVVGAVLLQTGVLPPGQAAGGEDGGGGPVASAPPGGTPDESAAPGESATPGGGGGGGEGIAITAEGVAFLEASFDAPAGQPFVIEFDNRDAGTPHDVDILAADGTKVFDGEIITGPATITYEVPALDAGTYTFICSVHPNMTGTVTIN